MSANLINNLAFTQDNLQDFIDCRRRFQLRHINRLAWPAIESDPVLEHERRMQQGSLFHKLIQQYYLGIPVEHLSTQIYDPDLQKWWTNFLNHVSTQGNSLNQAGPGQYFSENLLTGSLGGFQIRAKYDLIVTDPSGGVVIYDWKTTRRKPSVQGLAERIQTRLYPYLLVSEGGHLQTSGAILAEQVSMVYWFAEYPGQPVHFSYDREKFARDEAYLTDLIALIDSLKEDEFWLTAQIRQCEYCAYRSYCGRGMAAGDLDADEASLDDEFDVTGKFEFDQIQELPY